jgi:uncharacterized repeat protein (TIGR01451 family)
MTHPRFFRLLLIPVLILLIFAPVNPPVPSTLWSSLPLAFAADADAQGAPLYRAGDLDGSLAFQKQGFTLGLAARENVAVDFLGANASPLIEMADPLPGRINRISGSSRRTDIPTYGALVYRELYPGIDLRYEGTSGHLKGTYTLAPGADPALIRWRYSDGSASLSAEIVATPSNGLEAGDLQIVLGAERPALIERAPVAWQEIDGTQIPVFAAYTLPDDGSIGFTIGDYNPAYPLIIDPVLVYGTYYGGSNDETVADITVAPDGSVYIVGTTQSNNLPLANPLRSAPNQGLDVFLFKLDATGKNLLYATYLGGSDYERAGGVGIDLAGNIYITGSTRSNDFPVENGYQMTHASLPNSTTDAFVVKLNPAGNDLLYGTYYGGLGIDEAHGMVVTPLGEVYIAGYTEAFDFPTLNGLPSPACSSTDSSNAFVVHLNPAQTGATSRVYATKYGGCRGDAASDIALDEDGFIYIVGWTSSLDLVIQNGFQATPPHISDMGAGFVAKLNPSGTAVLYSSYLNGSGTDILSAAAAVDGDLYVVGSTFSNDFPVTPGAFDTQRSVWDGFATRIDTEKVGAASLVYSTYLGGSNSEDAYDVSVDSYGYAYVAGKTTSSSWFPLNSDSVQPQPSGYWDSFLVVLNATGEWIRYGTYLAGTQDDSATAIVLDSERNVYVAGETRSIDFIRKNPYQLTNRGGYDVFALRLEQPAPMPTAQLILSIYPNQTIYEGQTIQVTVNIHNDGPDAASDVVITSRLPAGLTFASANPEQGTYNPLTGEWNVGTMRRGAQTSLRLMATVNLGTMGQTLTQTATITLANPFSSGLVLSRGVSLVVGGTPEVTEEGTPGDYLSPTPSNTPSESTAEVTPSVTPPPTETWTPSNTPSPTTTSTPPDNDLFANAHVITSLPFVYTQALGSSTTSATDPDVIDLCDVYGSSVQSLWYRYTPSVNQRISVDSVGQTATGHYGLAVFTGTEGNLVSLGCHTSPYWSSRSYALSANVPYYIMFVTFNSPLPPTIEVHLNVRDASAPPNDHFANAQAVTTTPFTDTFAFYTATNEALDPNSSCDPYYPGVKPSSLWYRYTAPTEQSISLDLTTEENQQPLLGVFTGSPNSFIEQTCGISKVTFHAEAGESYWIIIKSGQVYSETHLFTTFSIATWPLVANDQLADALQITMLPFTDTQNVFGATSTAQTDPRTDCSPFPMTYPYLNTIWYHYTPSVSGLFQIDTRASDFNLHLAVYAGTPTLANRVACGDYGLVFVNGEAGVAYTIYIAAGNGYNPLQSSASTLRLNITPPPVPNDIPAGAVEVGSLPFNHVQDVLVASAVDEPQPNYCGNDMQQTVWFKYTPSATQTILLDADASSYPAKLYVFNSVLEPLIQCRTTSQLRLKVQANQTYYFVVAANVPLPAPAPAMLNLSISEIPSNDYFADALVIEDTALPYTHIQGLNGQTRSEDDPFLSCLSSPYGFVGSIWYAYTPTTTQMVTLRASNAYYLAQGVYTGVQGNLSEVACDKMVSDLLTTTFKAQAGTTYYFMVVSHATDYYKESWQATVEISAEPFVPTPTLTPSQSPTPSQTFTVTNTPTLTPTLTPSLTPSVTNTPTFTLTPTDRPDCEFADPIARISVSSTGLRTNSDAYHPAVSGDGRFVAYVSGASSLVVGDTNGFSDIFVYDRQTCRTTRVSVNSIGEQGNGSSSAPDISDDGRFIVFESYARNFHPNADNVQDVFLHDRQSGQTTRISGGLNGTEGYGEVPSISADGRYVVFSSGTDNLVPSDINGRSDVFRYDRQTDTLSTVSLGSDGTQANGDSGFGDISGDGRYITFVSNATNLSSVPNPLGYMRLYRKDMQTGAVDLVSWTSSGQPTWVWLHQPSISNDGRYIAFVSASPEFGVGIGYTKVFMRDMQAGTTLFVSRPPDGEPINNDSFEPAISGDGKYIVFHSFATNLSTGNPDGLGQVYLWDSTSGVINRVSRPVTGALAGNMGSGSPTISTDGQIVVFGSRASNLLSDGEHPFGDLYAVRPSAFVPLPTSTPTATQTPPNLISNGSFSSGMTGWATWDAITHRIQNGVFEFYRNSGGSSAVVLHPTGHALPAGAPLEIQLSLGNSSSVRKRVVLLMHDADFSDLQVCGFWIAPNTPLRNYIMRMTTNEAWNNATLSVYGSPADSLGWIRMDNVDVRKVSAVPAAKTLCIDPDTPTPTGGTAGANLLSNGDFSAPQIAPWATYGQINGRLHNGVYEFYRLAGAPSGVVLQPSGDVLPARSLLEISFQMGNSSNQRMRATVLLHEWNFSDSQACAFWLEPNTPLQTYTIRTYNTVAWTNATLSFYPSPAAQAGWLQLDNVVLRQNPSITSTGTACYVGTAPAGSVEPPSEPSATPEVILLPTPSLMPTMLPPVPSELPLLPTPSLTPTPAPQSEGELSETSNSGGG